MIKDSFMLGTIKFDINVVIWRQRKHLAQLRTGSHWLAVETGRYGNAIVERADEKTISAL